MKKAIIVSVECPDNPIAMTPLVEGAIYHWTPKVEDLDVSCHVDIADLTAIAKKYGENHVWS